MEPGDIVRLRGGTQTGEVVRVQPGAWSNGGVPMVSVYWHARTPNGPRYRGRHTQTQLVRVGEANEANA